MLTQYATYCPEDDKLRLYVGRVPRGEYEALRADGWVSTPKQDCDFVAVWTVSRESTALRYGGGEIEDEDQPPSERAADRAERFAGYREKREGEALGLADRYESGDHAHGYQSQARAERAAARHDRQGGRAVTQWDRAEYWTRRTAGVIANALHRSSPAVRMGRIKTIEADLRHCEAQYTPQGDKRYMDPETGAEMCLVGLGRDQRWRRVDGLAAMAQGYERHANHLRLRLAYENQMIEAQGGRAAFIDMVPGGWLGNRRILKVNKSAATGRVVSVEVMGTHSGYTRESGYTEYKTVPAPVLIKTERLPEDAYRAPTAEELAAFLADKRAKKAAEPKKEKPPLVNPTDEDAQRLQDALNAQALADHCGRHLRAYGRDYAEQFRPSTVCRVTQAVYSEASKGAYSRTETRGICRGGQMEPTKTSMYSPQAVEEAKKRGPKVCEVRTTSGDGSDYGARRVIVLTDKPQKPLPVAVWESVAVAEGAEHARA
jgi:hypothetical protein